MQAWLPPAPETVPEWLKEIPRWVMCSGPEHDPKNPKAPKRLDGYNAASDNPETWSNYGDALQALMAPGSKFAGFGVVMVAGSGIVAIDLDQLYDHSNGTILEPAQKVLEKFPTYTEVSPSGYGLRLFLKVQTPRSLNSRKTKLPIDGTNPDKSKLPGIEIFCGGQYVTVTGRKIDRSPSDLLEVTTVDLLEWIEETFQYEKPAYHGTTNGTRSFTGQSTFDGAAWMRSKFPEIEGREYKGGLRWVVPCPWNLEHKGTDAFVIMCPSGAMTMKCAHTSCGGQGGPNRWEEFRGLYDREYQSWIDNGRPASGYKEEIIPGVDDFFNKPTAMLTPPPKYKAQHPDPGPFPPHLLDVPGLIEDLMTHNLTTSRRPQPVLALASAIAAVGLLAGRRIKSPTGICTNVQIMAVAKSGHGKDRSVNLLHELVSKYAAIPFGGQTLYGYETQLASEQGLFSGLKETPCFLLLVDEAGDWFQKIRNRQMPHLNGIPTAMKTLYSNPIGEWKSPARADRSQSFVIENVHFVFYGTATPDKYLDGLTEESANDGQLSRMLFFEAPPERPVRCMYESMPMPESIRERVRLWKEWQPGGALVNHHTLEPMTVDYGPGVQAIYDALDDQSENVPEGIAATLWTRAAQKAVQCGLIHAASRWEHPGAGELIIDLEAAQWSVELVTYLTNRLLHLTEDRIGETDWDKHVAKILTLVRQSENGISARDLRRGCRSFMDRFDKVLSYTLACQHIVEQHETTKGRPKTLYVAVGRDFE